MEHPCKGMTKAQIAAFEQIAINQPPACKWGTLDALLKAGVIERGQGEIQRDAMGVYEIPSFFVPLPVHYQWCAWASEQEEMRDGRDKQIGRAIRSGCSNSKSRDS